MCCTAKAVMSATWPCAVLHVDSLKIRLALVLGAQTVHVMHGFEESRAQVAAGLIEHSLDCVVGSAQESQTLVLADYRVACSGWFQPDQLVRLEYFVIGCMIHLEAEVMVLRPD